MKSQFQSKEELEKLIQELSIEGVGQRYNVTVTTVYRSMARLNISTPLKDQSRGHPMSRGDKHWHWKGGRILNGEGYVLLYIPNLGDYVLEHRLVMEQQLGRPLKPGEKVHHRNGIRDDNRPENLQLVIPNSHYSEIECPYCSKKFVIQ